jgi:hypothetical protein
MTDKKEDELAALKARVAELERAAKPPEPYINDWVPPPNPIDRLSMPMSAMREMAQAVPDAMIREIVKDHRGPIGPSSAGAIPSSQTLSNVRGVPGMGTGWQNQRPLGPSMHQRYVEQQLNAQDEKDRAELVERLGKK